MSQELEANLEPRLVLYHVLSLAFYEPSQALELLADQEAGAELVEAAETLLGTQGWSDAQELENAYLQAKADGERGILDLHAEYNRLFVGPTPPVCPPYQSVYDMNRPTAEQGTIMGPTAEAVERAMRQEGMALSLDHVILADHAAVELEFMFYLLMRAMENPEQSQKYITRAKEFRAAHILPWLGMLGERVGKAARHPLYEHAGRLLHELVEAEKASA